MNLNKLSPAEKIIAGSGAVLVIVSLLPWFGLNVQGVKVNRTGWQNPLSSFGIIVGVLMTLQVLLSRFSSATLPTPPVPWGRMHLILGVLAFALIGLQALVGDEVRGPRLPGLPRINLELDPKYGLYIGLAAAAGLAIGGFRRSKEPESSGLY